MNEAPDTYLYVILSIVTIFLVMFCLWTLNKVAKIPMKIGTSKASVAGSSWGQVIKFFIKNIYIVLIPSFGAVLMTFSLFLFEVESPNERLAVFWLPKLVVYVLPLFSGFLLSLIFQKKFSSELNQKNKYVKQDFLIFVFIAAIFISWILAKFALGIFGFWWYEATNK